MDCAESGCRFLLSLERSQNCANISYFLAVIIMIIVVVTAVADMQNFYSSRFLFCIFCMFSMLRLSAKNLYSKIATYTSVYLFLLLLCRFFPFRVLKVLHCATALIIALSIAATATLLLMHVCCCLFLRFLF